MDAIYVSANQFIVSGDRTAEFIPGRRCRANCDTDGYKYSNIESSSYSDPNTTVTLTESELTSNLFEVHYGIVSQGETGSLPVHDHTNDEGQGGPIDDNMVLVGDGAPTTELGIPYDAYIDETNSDFHYKDEAAYGANTLDDESKVSASSQGNGTREYAVNAIRYQPTWDNYYWQAQSTTNQWWKYDFGAGNEKVIAAVDYMKAYTSPKNFSIQGSNDDTLWQNLYTGVGPDTNDYTLVEFNNTTAYRYYRFYITDCYATSGYAGLHEIKMYESGSYDWRKVFTIVQDFLDLEDTPDTYSGADGQQLVVSGTNIVFQDVTVVQGPAGEDGTDGATWYVETDDPLQTEGNTEDLWLNETTYDIFTKDQPSLSGDLALNQPVTADSVLSTLFKEYAVDGDSLTRWSSNVFINGWIQVDVGSEVQMNRLVVTNGSWKSVLDFELRGSNNSDGSNYTVLVDDRHPDADHTTVTYDFFGNTDTFRYYRLYMNSSTSNNISVADYELYSNAAFDWRSIGNIKGADGADGECTCSGVTVSGIGSIGSGGNWILVEEFDVIDDTLNTEVAWEGDTWERGRIEVYKPTGYDPTIFLRINDDSGSNYYESFTYVDGGTDYATSRTVDKVNLSPNQGGTNRSGYTVTDFYLKDGGYKYFSHAATLYNTDNTDQNYFDGSTAWNNITTVTGLNIFSALWADGIPADTTSKVKLYRWVDVPEIASTDRGVGAQSIKIEYKSDTEYYINPGAVHLKNSDYGTYFLEDREILSVSGTVFEPNTWYYFYVSEPAGTNKLSVSNFTLVSGVPSIDYENQGRYLGDDRCVGFVQYDGFSTPVAYTSTASRYYFERQIVNYNTSMTGYATVTHNVPFGGTIADIFVQIKDSGSQLDVFYPDRTYPDFKVGGLLFGRDATQEVSITYETDVDENKQVKYYAQASASPVTIDNVKIATIGFEIPDYIYTGSSVGVTTSSGTGGGGTSDVQTFLDLEDTPTTYSGSDGKVLYSTGSGIAFSNYGINSVDTDYYGYELVGEYALENNTMDVTLSGIKGDTDDRWMIEGNFSSEGSVVILAAHLNDDTTSNYTNSYVSGANNSVASDSGYDVSSWQITSVDANIEVSSITNLFLKTGQRRAAVQENYRYGNGVVTHNVTQTSTWKNTVDEVTKMRLFTDNNATGWVRVYKHSKMTLPVKAYDKTYCKAKLSGDQSISSSTITLDIDTVFAGDESLLNNSNQFVIPEDGLYNVNYQVAWTGGSVEYADAYELGVSVRKNGATILNSIREGQEHGAGWNGMGVNHSVPNLELEEGDLIDFRIYQWNADARYLSSNSWAAIERADQAILVTISGTGGGTSDVQSFLDLEDTPSYYDEGKYLVSTASGLDWTPTISGIPEQLHMAKVACDTNVSLPNATYVKIPFNITEIDNGDIADTTTNNRINIKQDGTYLISSTVERLTIMGDGDIMNISIYKNGAQVENVSKRSAAATAVESLQITTTLECVEDDYIEIYVKHEEGATQTSHFSSYNPVLSVVQLAEYTGGSGGGGTSDVQSFLDLNDTPTTYSGSEGQLLYSTGSGIAFSELQFDSVETDYYGYELVGSYTLSNETLDVTYSGVKGDTDDRWLVECYFTSAGSIVGLQAHYNDDTTTGNYTGSYIAGSNNSTIAASDYDTDSLQLVGVDANVQLSAIINLFLTSGQRRSAQQEGHRYGTGSTTHNITGTATWKNTVDEITKIRLFTDTNATGWIKVYKQARMEFPYTLVSGTGGGSSDVQSFLDLEDTPTTYSGAENYYLKVTSSGNGVEFVESEMPSGGERFQVLMKESSLDGDYTWRDYRQLHTASGIPSAVIGNATDHYIDLITGDIYQKNAGSDDLSDDFTGPDNSAPDDVLWGTYTSPQDGNGKACHISNNALYTYMYGSSSSAYSYWHGVEAKTALTGDFLIETFVTTWDGTLNRAGSYFEVAGVGALRVWRDSYNSDRATLSTYNSAGSKIDDLVIESNPFNLTLRLERVGSTLNAQYKQDGQSIFTTLSSFTTSTSDGKVRFYSYVYDSTSYTEANWDYYEIVAGGTGDPWTLERDNPNSFIELEDTPTTYSGAENHYLKVTSSGNGVEFVDAAWPETFIELEDTPVTYSDSENHLLISTGSGIEFTPFEVKFASTDYEGLELIGELTNSAADSITIDIVDEDETIIIDCINMDTSASMRVNQDTGSNYNWGWYGQDGTGFTGGHNATHSYFELCPTDPLASSSCKFFPKKTGNYRAFFATVSRYNSGNPDRVAQSLKGHWANTDDIVTSITVSKSAGDGIVKVYRQTKLDVPVLSDKYEESDYYVKELIEEWNLESGSIDDTFEWDGDTEEVFVEFAFNKDTSSAVDFLIIPNNDVAANYNLSTFTVNNDNTTSTSYNSPASSNGLFVAGTGSASLNITFRGEFRTNLKLSDAYRKSNSDLYRSDTWTWSQYMTQWTNTTDRVSSINVKLTGDVTGWVKLYKRHQVDIPIVKEPVGNWILVEDITASGTNWSYSVDWPGDEWPRAKIELYSGDGLTAPALRLNNDSGNNYYQSHNQTAGSSVTGFSDTRSLFEIAPYLNEVDRTGFATTDLYLKSDAYKFIINSVSLHDESQTNFHHVRWSQMWNDNTNAVTSLDFVPSIAGEIDANIKLYRWQDISDVNSGMIDGLPAGIQTLKVEYWSGNEFFINPGTVDLNGNFYRHETRTAVSGTGLTADTWYYVYAKAPTTRRGLQSDDFSYEEFVPVMDWNKLGYYHPYIKTKRCIGYFYSSSTSSVKEWRANGHNYNFTGGSTILSWVSHTSPTTFNAYSPLGGEEISFKARFTNTSAQTELYITNPDTSSRVHLGTAQTSYVETVHTSYNCSSDGQLTIEGDFQGDIMQDGFSISDYIYTG